jgi:NADPH:quinone reductase-like Zn-dependent oxidoreductase
MDDIPIPVPAPDEVLVRVHATSINPIDWKICSGEGKGKFPVPLPLTPGWDLSGVVEETGEQVQGFKKGDEVYGRPSPLRNGAYAEFMVVKAGEINFKPKSIDHVLSAAIPLAGLTAWQGLFDLGGLDTGQKILIQAASGGVGTFAVQFARWKGAYVAGTTSTENAQLVADLGADKVIDYKKERFEDLLSGFDLVFDTLGGDVQKRSLTVLKDGGTLVTTVKPETTQEASRRNITVKSYMAQSFAEQLKLIADLVDYHKVRPVVSEILPLEDVARGQKKSMDGHVRGKIAIRVVW